MDPEQPTPIRELTRIAHPWVLLSSLLFYALGAGIVVYLGGSLRGDVYLIGQLAAILMPAAAYFLRETYAVPLEAIVRPGRPAPIFTRSALLAVAATLLTSGAILTVILFSQGALNPPAFVILAIAFFLTLAYAVPPLRLAYSGYGELIFAVLLVNLTPALAFLLQTGEFHRLLALLTFPLTFLYLATNLALNLGRYSDDIRQERKTMLTRLGWQRGMNLHNLLILIGFFVLGSAALVGLPWSLTWPGLLGLPFGVFQIVQMNMIAAGGKPRWRLLNVNAGSTLAVTAYFIALALWTG